MRITNIILLTFAITLFGCTDIITERTGAEIVVIPVETTYSFHSMSKDGSELQYRVDELLDEHFSTIRTQGIKLESRTPSGEKLARSIKNSLLEKGVDGSKITLNESVHGENEFDLIVHVTQFKVVSHQCDYTRVGQYRSSKLGCSIENSRWHSLVNPQTALSTTAKSK
jgi:hypothetical protein